MPPSNPTQTLLLTLLLLTNLHQTTPFIIPFTLLPNLPSLSHTLLTRVSTLRLSRSDTRGADRANLLAEKLNLQLTGRRVWPTVFKLGWACLKDYAISRGTMSVRGVKELVRLRDDFEGFALDRSNKVEFRRVFKEFVARLLDVVVTSESLKELVEEEMEEGDLINDFLEVGGNELKSLFQFFKNFIPIHNL